MKYPMMIATALAVTLVCVIPQTARADECNKLVDLTFSGPVALPGVSLPAGTYRFSHPDCSVTSNVLRVSSENGLQVYGTFLTIPDERTTPTSQAEVVFAETGAGSPRAIRSWFYPGEKTGDELIYPKSQAAKVAGAPVKTVVASNGLT